MASIAFWARYVLTLLMLCSLTLAGVLIAFYIVTAIYEAKYLIPLTRVLSICHPDWGWCLAMGAAICWWLTSLLAIGESRITLQYVPVRNSQLFQSGQDAWPQSEQAESSWACTQCGGQQYCMSFSLYCITCKATRSMTNLQHV